MNYFHGSMDYLPVGTILCPQSDYASRWGHTDFYEVLEKYRPQDMIAHSEGVFMCSDNDDVDLAGGGTEWLFTVKPIGKIEKHDLNWGSEISCLLSENGSEDQIRQAAENYWNGVPHHDENVWEFIAREAEIIAVAPFLNPNAKMPQL